MSDENVDSTDEEVVGSESVETEEVEVEEVEEVDDILIAFQVAIDAGKDEDDIKMDMIGAGAKFKNVTRIYNQAMIDSGLVKSKDEKDEILNKILGDVVLTDPETFDACVAEIAEDLGVEEKSASGSLRQWAKKAGVEFYKKPKGSGGSFSGITAKIHAWILENPTASEEELVPFLKEVGTANTMNHKASYISILRLANGIAAKYS